MNLTLAQNKYELYFGKGVMHHAITFKKILQEVSIDIIAPSSSESLHYLSFQVGQSQNIHKSFRNCQSNMQTLCCSY